MTILSNSDLVPAVLPGLAHRTLADAEHGLTKLAVWSQSLDPQGATPPHRHDCEEVILVTEGEGTLAIDGQEKPFRAGDTIIVPPNAPHQLINTGSGPLRTLGIFSVGRVRVEFPDGTPIDLPWQ